MARFHLLRRLTLTVAVAAMVIPFAAVSAQAQTVHRHHRHHHYVWMSKYDKRLLRDINHARAAHHRRRLIVTAGTTDVAHWWSCSMARHDRLSHRPNIVHAISHRGSRNWGVIGENVGWTTSADPDVLFQAYMHSPEHRANILDRSYRYLGIRTKVVAGVRWNTLDFVDRYSERYGRTRSHC